LKELEWFKLPYHQYFYILINKLDHCKLKDFQ
jgi:hypothetical protein